MLAVLGIPAAVSAAGFAYVADNPLAAAGVGAVVGLVIGFAILAFPISIAAARKTPTTYSTKASLTSRCGR